MIPSTTKLEGSKMGKQIANAMLVILTIMGLAMMFTMSYTDAKQDEKHYCQMVEEGTWPDFKHIYDEQCKESI